jgi:hypothetical protein
MCVQFRDEQLKYMCPGVFWEVVVGWRSASTELVSGEGCSEVVVAGGAAVFAMVGLVQGMEWKGLKEYEVVHIRAKLE